MIDSNSQFFATLTAVGEAKQANATALGIPWTFKEMAVGDANGTDPVPNKTQTKLINEWRRAPVNQVRTDPANPNVIITEQVIPPDVGGHWIREIGLFDADGDLVAVASCAPTFKPLLAQGTGKTQIIRMNFIVSNTAQIVLKIDPSVVLATRQYVDDSLATALPANKTPGTYRQVTIDKRGIVTSGSNPTTLEGSGITDGVTKTELSNAVNALVPKTGGTMTGSVILSNGGDDTPEFGWKSPTCEAFMDVLTNQVRISANYGGTFHTPLLLNIPAKAASVFGYGLWHTGNFDASKKADVATTYTRLETDQQINYRALRDKITTVGMASNDPNLPYMHRESDGVVYYLQPRLGFTPVQQGGGTGQLANKIMIGWSAQGLKAQVDTLDLGLLWNSQNFNPNDKADKVATTNALAQCIKLGQSVQSGSNPSFSSSGSGPIAYLSGASGAVEIHNGGVANASAVAMFNRMGVFATYFGLDTDNQLKVGGISMGNVAHTVWHSGNTPKNTASLVQNGWKKDADTGEIVQWIEVVIGEISGSRIQSVAWPTAFPNAFLNAQVSFRQGASNLPCNIGAAYSSPTQAGCVVRIDEWSGIDQGTSLTLVVQARGY
ncbi:phage tail protein [Pseudomonas sp. MPFS]|uniref:phage tail protein n=1 Tax=Pseudomonas sp. MPFS TaxID=2795724 RepID=UPI001F137FF6|nr:phage tail protein [Pseudomonas sp. MPFS]UMZ13282.1 phage tail protein [Pseudomonas sp. MPFS]